MDAGKPMQQPEPDSLDAGDTNDVPPPLDVPSAMDSGQPMDSSVASTMTPSMSMSCQPGLYEGTFEGPITFAVGTINSVKGTLRAELVLGALANTLLVSSGTISGEDDTGVGMTARWTGRLNCETKQLENARHENGIWDNGTTFMGTLEGRYSADPYALDGTWQVRSEQIPLAAGSGTWHMDLQQSPFGEN